MGGIYAWKFKYDPKIIYIGLSTCFETRKAWHIKKLLNKTHENKKFLNFVTKYSLDSFEFIIIKEVERKYNDTEETYLEKLSALEKFYIEKYQSYYGYKTGGLNLTRGGETKFNH